MQYDDDNIDIYENNIIKKDKQEKLKLFRINAILGYFNKKDLEFFIKVLKHSTDYFPKKGKYGEHWTGRFLLSNRDMHNMCLDKFKKDYELLTNPEQRKIRDHIFRHLRGKQNG